MIEWRPIPGYEGLYDVSDHGDIRSHDRIVNRFDRTHVLKGRVLRQGTARHGHKYVILCKDNKPKTCMVHQLVLLAFIGGRPLGHVSRHIDGNPSNNHKSNLIYGTQKENLHDRIAHGTVPVGENHKHHKLTESTIRCILSDIKMGLPQRSIAKKYNISQPTVCAINRGNTWKWMLGKEDKSPC